MGITYPDFDVPGLHFINEVSLLVSYEQRLIKRHINIFAEIIDHCYVTQV